MIAQSKSILAKLLAKENIRVEHRKVQTAYFDLKSRVLVCPLWGEMTPELYDLLLGHEVSHALHTPEEGWHDEVTTHKGGFKTYLNVIEDARIERKIKALYPGLKPSFSKAYQELTDREFFGPSHIVESDLLPLIDRINLHFKIGPFANIQFKENELEYVDRASKTETWEEVAALAKELHELGKNERKELQDKLNQVSKMYDESEYEDWHDDEYADYEDSPDQLDFGSDGEGEEADNLDELREILEMMRPNGTPDGEQTDDDDNRSVTDTFFRNKEGDLLDAKSKPYCYADLPTPKLNDIVIPYKTVLKHTNFIMKAQRPYCFEGPADPAAKTAYENKKIAMVNSIREDTYINFMNANKKYISYLVKEFELRKNARQFARASIAKTGELDVKKIFSYQFNEDIFKRVTSIPGGKNHGMLMFIDFSGSMTSNIKATIEQTLLLAIFCRKIGVPFRVFSFSDVGNPEWRVEDPKEEHKHYTDISNNNLKFSINIGEVFLSNPNFFMAEYISSDMSPGEFTTASKNLLMLAKLLKGDAYGRDNNFIILDEYHHITVERAHGLNGTPLDETVAASIFITEDFKKKYRLDVVNAIFLTDGQGATSAGTITKYYDRDRWGSSPEGPVHNKITHIDVSSTLHDESLNFVVREKKTNIQGFSPSGSPTTVAYLDLLAKVTGANVIGFYLMHRPNASRLNEFSRSYGKYMSHESQTEATKMVRQHKYAQIDVPGYKKMFVLPDGRDLEIEEDILEVSNPSDKNNLKKAFMKMQKNKLTSRVFLSKFIEQIA